MTRQLKLGAALVVFVLLEWVAIVLWHFPWAVDTPVNREQETRSFYAQAYKPSASTGTEAKYAQVADSAARAFRVRERVAQFVAENHLEHAHVLEVGSGNGKLQDVVADYTGLDISRTVALLYHKPFVVGTATAMPFKDGEFDALWSIWVLEHIPNPEAALNEMRRVVKPGGLLYLMPAWDCVPWAADGYDVRPYSDFGWYGKLVKISLPFRTSPRFVRAYKTPIRLIRSLAASPTRLHYRCLIPNYQEYWQPDSDAVNSIDREEVVRWFTSRGDDYLWRSRDAVEIRIRK